MTDPTTQSAQENGQPVRNDGQEFASPDHLHETGTGETGVENSRETNQSSTTGAAGANLTPSRYELYVIWGKTPVCKVVYQFNSREERSAFVHGVEDAVGYMDAGWYMGECKATWWDEWEETEVEDPGTRTELVALGERNQHC